MGAPADPFPTEPLLIGDAHLQIPGWLTVTLPAGGDTTDITRSGGATLTVIFAVAAERYATGPGVWAQLTALATRTYTVESIRTVRIAAVWNIAIDTLLTDHPKRSSLIRRLRRSAL